MVTVGSERGQWSSRTGFILAAAGSAIGLGNIWRFPYIAGQNGGGAFVLLYVLFVAIIGLPYMFAELSLGRAMQKNPVGAIDAIKPGSGWRAVGTLGVLTGVGILSFYGVSRKKIVGLAALFTFLVGVPSALSQGATDFWTNFGVLPARLTGDPDFLSHMSFVFGDFSLAFGALLMSIFVGWVWGANKAADEITHGSAFFREDSRHLDVHDKVFYPGCDLCDFVESIWLVRLTPVDKR